MKKLNPYKRRPRNELVVKRIGLKSSLSSDCYHMMMKLSWVQFFLLFTVSYLIINTFFASLYYFNPGSIVNANDATYWEAFLFSFQTSSTLGYGYFLPNNDFANIVVIFDVISGVLFVAIATGLAFSKFSRPTARILFTESMLLARYEGNDVLMFRMANARSSKVVDANVTVVMSRPELSSEGTPMTRMYDLKLVRSQSPLFGLTWTVMHIIDEESPFKGIDLDTQNLKDSNIIISLTGIDDVYAATIYDRCIYLGSDIKKGKNFSNVMGKNSDGNLYIDYSKFHEIDSL